MLPSRSAVFAASTPALGVSSCTGTNWTNCSNAFTEDGSYGSVYVDDIQDDTVSYGVTGLSIPNGSTITGITLREKGKFSGGGGTCQKMAAFSKDGGSTWQTNSVGNDLQVFGCNGTLAFTTWTTNSSYANFNSYNWSATDFGSNFRILIGYNVTVPQTRQADYVDVYVSYEPPQNSLQIATASASPVNGYASISFTGTTTQHSEQMLCDVALMERCSKSGYATINSSVAIAHIKLDGSYRENTTVDLGAGYYKGYGWGIDNSWVADNVHVPYHDGYVCDYPMYLTCQTNRVIDFQEGYDTNSNLVATPSSTLMNQSISTPEPTDPLAWLAWKIRETFIELFYPHDSITTQLGQYKDELLATKAPFAYAKAVFDLDWNNTAESTASPTIHIALASNGGGILPDINWTPPAFFEDGMALLRNAFIVVLWANFVLYIVVRARTLFV